MKTYTHKQENILKTKRLKLYIPNRTTSKKKYYEVINSLKTT